jgi:hypothetical protein
MPARLSTWPNAARELVFLKEFFKATGSIAAGFKTLANGVS